MWLQARFRRTAVAVSAAGVVLVCLGLVAGRVTAAANGQTTHTGVLDLGLEWIGFLLGVLVMGAGVVRLMKHDSQSRGMLLVSGIVVVALTVWEIITIQDRVVRAVTLTFPFSQRLQVEVALKEALRTGQLDISPNVGMYLLLVGGVLAIGAAVLARARARPAAPGIPAAPAPHSTRGEVAAPSSPVASAGPSMAEVHHGAGERCRACRAILGDGTDVCWYCGRTWEPEPQPS